MANSLSALDSFPEVRKNRCKSRSNEIPGLFSEQATVD